MIFACDGHEDNDNTEARMLLYSVVILECSLHCIDMLMAWRARDPLERIAYARKAIKANERCCV